MALVFYATPGLAAMSGRLKVQTGITEGGDPVYSDCGTLNLFKGGPNGREWHLDDTCNQLIDLMVPSGPTPVITPSPTPGGGPTPRPTTSVSGDCQGTFTKLNNTNWVLNHVTLEEGKTLTFCAELPASTRPFFEIYSVNRGNSSCSQVVMDAISPSGLDYSSTGVAPGASPFVQAGVWKIKLLLEYGCTLYDLNIVY